MRKEEITFRVLVWLALLALPPVGSQGGVVFNSLHSFSLTNDGASPRSVLLQGTDGNFYGTAYSGGAYGYGTVFQMTPGGTLTRLYSFTGGNDGASPSAALVQNSNGNLYGTTVFGGTNGYGTVFQIGTDGALTSLHSFDYSDGAYPYAGLVQGSDGSLYGTTEFGGMDNNGPFIGGQGYGAVFQINTAGALTNLHSFDSYDGAYPSVVLLRASNSYFYGTTSSGSGAASAGTVFQISAEGVLTTLYLFT